MFGWRARIGILVPIINVVAEPEMYRMAPDGVTIHASRIYLPKEGLDFSQEGVESNWKYLTQSVEKAAESFLDTVIDVIAYTCTSGTFYGGPNFNKELVKKIKKISGIPTTTTSTALLEAIKLLKIKKIAVATPYVEKTNQKLKIFLEGNGVEVINIKGLGYTTGESMVNAPQNIVYHLAKGVDKPEANSVFIACTGFPTIDIIEKLEADLGKPVITANQVTFWNALRIANIHDSIDGYGVLLKNH